jgi:AcrR family transcriptional regulator
MNRAISAVVLNKHQAKTEATLRSVLDAAEKIFVRDGYERAQIEMIAAEAGRTKGAVYAHFRSKEDIFFALLERKAQARRDEFIESAHGKNHNERRELVKKLFLGALEEENWPILLLEFKLWALRNDASLQRVRALYKLLYEDMSRAILSETEPLSTLRGEKDIVALAILRGIPSAIILEKKFNPVLISSAVAGKVFENIFDALLGSDNNGLTPHPVGVKVAERLPLPLKGLKGPRKRPPSSKSG